MLAELRERCQARRCRAEEVLIANDLSGLAQADFIFGVSDVVDTLVEPEHLNPGAVVCNAARPREVSARGSRAG